MGGGGNNPDFWGEIGLTTLWIVAAFVASVIAVGVVLIAFGAGWA